MQKRIFSVGWFGPALALLLVTLVGLAAFGQSKEEKKPSITISSVPSDPPGENMASEPIKGTVSGVNPNEHKVVIYARGGDKWWVQPYVASPYTDIDSEGKWETETHGGTEFAALLVNASSSFRPNATLGTLPEVGGVVLAMAKKKPEEKSGK